MNRSFSIAFLFFFFIFKTPLHAKKNWKEITLITKSNETIVGEVSIKTNFKYYPTLPARDKITHGIKTYYPCDVKSFTIKMEEQDLYFKVFRIEAEYSENDLPLLDNSPTIKLERQTPFLLNFS